MVAKQEVQTREQGGNQSQKEQKDQRFEQHDDSPRRTTTAPLCKVLEVIATGFRPRAGATGLLIIAFPSFIGLGIWQLDRARIRTNAEQRIHARAQLTPIHIPPVLIGADVLQDRHVLASGHYEPEHQFLLDNRVRLGQAGFEVITPLRIANSEVRVLVDRGWVPGSPDLRRSPSVKTPTEPLAVEGIAVVPSTWTFTLAPLENHWSPIWQHLDLERFRSMTGVQVQPVVIQLSPQSSSGGFTREWPRAATGAARNISYAIQWFGFAAAALTGGLWLSLGRKRE
jgi:surfeit locus 1 family protein